MLIKSLGVQQEPVTIAELKTHLKIEHNTTEDAYLTGLISAARGAIEGHLLSSLALQTWEARYCQVSGTVYLPMPPVRSIESVVVDGVEVPEESYNLLGTRAIYFASPLVSDFPAGVVVRYVAGYQTPPPALKQAVLIFAAYLYEARTGEPPEVKYQAQVDASGPLPTAVAALISGYRVHRI